MITEGMLLVMHQNNLLKLYSWEKLIKQVKCLTFPLAMISITASIRLQRADFFTSKSLAAIEKSSSSFFLFASFYSVYSVRFAVFYIFRVATAQEKRGIWKSLFSDRENTGNLFKNIKNMFLHREFTTNKENLRVKNNEIGWNYPQSVLCQHLGL